ncbi:hypothetical protein H5410_040666 [Solanum commersonii]|uniref:Non-LTR retroelement reverse transcriptase n=1 Tax=Solanum commersonii TaxID=4109 RepID=A0A9J5XSM8_SOLCO|nr:hypothetical protein H5410_040666 [Solanum commersonii]
MYQLENNISCPWMVGGDFNVVMNGEEMIQGLPVQPQEVEDFVFCINSCKLEQISFKGRPFTRCNGRAGEDCIFESMDRMFVNQQLQAQFGYMEVEDLVRTRSDHALMLCSFDTQAQSFNKPFRFQKIWTEHVDFLEVVRQIWLVEEGPNPFITFKNKPKIIKSVLTKWSRGNKNDNWIEDEEQIVTEALEKQEDNDLLSKMPTMEEVKEVKSWDIVGVDILRLVCCFFQGPTLPKSITHSHLVLLPKKDLVQTYSNLRPIGLSNFVNKVFSRVIHGRVEKVLPNLISSNHSGFVQVEVSMRMCYSRDSHKYQKERKAY